MAKQPKQVPHGFECDAEGNPVAAQPAPAESTAVAVTKRAGPLSPSRQPGEGEKRITSSYNPADPDQRKLAIRAALNQDVRAEDVLNQTLHVVHWVTLDAIMLDPDTGEEKPFVRTVLVEEDGRRISAGSEWLLSSLRSIESFIGPAPWHPPLSLCIVASKARSGRTFYALDLV